MYCVAPITGMNMADNEKPDPFTFTLTIDDDVRVDITKDIARIMMDSGASLTRSQWMRAAIAEKLGKAK